MEESESESSQGTSKYPFLIEEFLELINQIGEHGHRKHSVDSIYNGVKIRPEHQRWTPEGIAEHAKQHFESYLKGEAHDHFRTRKHQLAAVAFNAMLEYYFAGEEQPQASGHSTR